MRAIILAGGQSTRWQNHLGVRKHELIVDGETLLARMIRLLREGGVEDVVMVGPYDYGVRNFRPTDDHDLIDGRLAIRPAWNPDGRTVILMGDVFYSEAAMATIIYGACEPCLFARFTGSAITGKHYGEIFADSFLPEHQAGYVRSLRAVLNLKAQGKIRRAGLWEAYLLDHGHLRPREVANYGDAVEIDDWTEDFDYPLDWDRWVARRA